MWMCGDDVLFLWSLEQSVMDACAHIHIHHVHRQMHRHKQRYARTRRCTCTHSHTCARIDTNPHARTYTEMRTHTHAHWLLFFSSRDLGSSLQIGILVARPQKYVISWLVKITKMQWTSVTYRKTVNNKDLAKKSTFLLTLRFAGLINNQADATLGNDVRDAVAKQDGHDSC